MEEEEKKGPGRHLKLTPELIKKAVRYLRQGNYVVTVCAKLGITEATWYGWQKKGEEASKNGENNIFFEFFESIKKASADAEIKAVREIRKAGRDHWQAWAWFLERRFSKRFAQKSRFEVEGDIKVSVKKPTNEDGSEDLTADDMV